MSDNFEADQIAATEMGKQDINKFRAYFDRLKEKLGSGNGTIILVNSENIGQPELDVYKKFVTFVKSLSADNCDFNQIAATSKELVEEAKKCSEKNFSAWIKNEVGPFSMLKFLATSWEGSVDDEGDKGLKFVVDYALANTDPENLY